MLEHLTASGQILALVVAALGGGFFNRLLDSVLGRRARKIDEAEALSRIGATLRVELQADNAAMEVRLGQVGSALVELTAILDDLFPKIEGLSVDERIALRQANSRAKVAGIAAAGVVKLGGAL